MQEPICWHLAILLMRQDVAEKCRRARTSIGNGASPTIREVSTHTNSKNGEGDLGDDRDQVNHKLDIVQTQKSANVRKMITRKSLRDIDYRYAQNARALHAVRSLERLWLISD